MIEIPLWRLTLLLIPLACVGWFAWRWGSHRGELAIATARMVVQLLVVGYLLTFLFGAGSPWISLGIVAFMVAVSSWIAIRTVHTDRAAALQDALLAIGVGGGLVFVLVIFGVLELRPWFEPRYVIPLAGMVFANAMTAVTLSSERFDAERNNGAELLTARNTAWNAALIPQVNSFLAVGLVALPGMMTGQILAGANPLIAVRYQIMVMAMVMGSAGLAVAIFLARRVGRLHRTGGRAKLRAIEPESARRLPGGS